MTASISIDEIFAQDRENHPNERTLPWKKPATASPSSSSQSPIGPRTCACSGSMPVNIAATPSGQLMVLVPVSSVISIPQAMI